MPSVTNGALPASVHLLEQARETDWAAFSSAVADHVADTGRQEAAVERARVKSGGLWVARARHGPMPSARRPPRPIVNGVRT